MDKDKIIEQLVNIVREMGACTKYRYELDNNFDRACHLFFNAMKMRWNGPTQEPPSCMRNNFMLLLGFNGNESVRMFFGDWLLMAMHLNGLLCSQHELREILYPWIAEEVRKYAPPPIDYRQEKSRKSNNDSEILVPDVGGVHLSEFIKIGKFFIGIK